MQDAVDKVRSSGAASTRHLLAVVCVAAVFLASHDNLLSGRRNFTRLCHATNLSRYITLAEMEDILKGYKGEDRSSRSNFTGKRRKRKDGREGKTVTSNRDVEGSHRREERRGQCQDNKGEREDDRLKQRR